MGLVKSEPIVSSPTSVESTPQEKSIIVIPFENRSPDKDDEYFSDGLTEEIITDLSKIQALRVISRSSAMKLKGTQKDVKTLGRDLNVRYVLEGSLRKAKNTLRITAELVDTVSDMQLWAEKYSGTIDNVFEFQEKLSRSIVAALKAHLSPVEDQKLAERPITHVGAYECYIKARQELLKFTEAGLNKAIALLERGLELDGENATLYATLATTYLYFHHFGLNVSEEVLRRASQYATRSLSLDPACLQARVVSGIIFFKRGQPQEAARMLKGVLVVDPVNVDALFWISVCYFISGKADLARPYSEKLLQVDPLTVASQVLPTWIEYYSGDIELAAAIPNYEKWLQLDPEGPFTRWCCAVIFGYNSNLERSFEVFDSVIRDWPNLVFSKHALFYKCALQGDKAGDLLYATKELKEAATSNDYLRVQMAVGFSLIDEKDEAVAWLRRALQAGFTNYPWLQKDPYLKKLEGHPGFNSLKSEMKQKWEAFEV